MTDLSATGSLNLKTSYHSGQLLIAFVNPGSTFDIAMFDFTTGAVTKVINLNSNYGSLNHYYDGTLSYITYVKTVSNLKLFTLKDKSFFSKINPIIKKLIQLTVMGNSSYILWNPLHYLKLLFDYHNYQWAPSRSKNKMSKFGVFCSRSEIRVANFGNI